MPLVTSVSAMMAVGFTQKVVHALSSFAVRMKVDTFVINNPMPSQDENNIRIAVEMICSGCNDIFFMSDFISERR